MLKALPFGTWYAMDGNYLTIAVLNFVIAICMFGTPLVVRSLVGSGFSAMTSGLAGVTGAIMLAAPAKALAFKAVAGSVASDTGLLNDVKDRDALIKFAPSVNGVYFCTLGEIQEKKLEARLTNGKREFSLAEIAQSLESKRTTDTKSEGEKSA